MPELRDALLAFVLITVPIITYFLLIVISPTAENSTLFFAILFGVAYPTLLIIWLIQFLDQRGVINYEIGPLLLNQNPGILGLLFGIGLGFVTFIFNVAVFQFESPADLAQTAQTLNLLYIPGSLNALGPTVYPTFSDAVFDFTLVGPAEEALKASMMFGIFMLVPLAPVAFLAAGVSIFFWAVFHTILAGFSLFGVVMAFITGSIWMAGWAIAQKLGEDNEEGGSILIPILAHSTYDSLVIVLIFLSGYLAVGFVVFCTLAGVGLVAGYAIKKAQD
ncbi:MAG: hypothetical protein KGN01_06405 [Patescibacteria group bacterium]|nr:hypothetical protein [Patescibacteria group bacterium]